MWRDVPFATQQDIIKTWDLSGYAHYTQHNNFSALDSSTPWPKVHTELQSKVREDFTIMEKAPTSAFSWLKAPTRCFHKTLLGHYAKLVSTHTT